MPDMLVKLYNIPDEIPNINHLKEKGISIKRVLAPDKHKVIKYVRDKFGDNWASECDVAFANKPISCYVAVKDKKIIGFACFDATARNYFGPTGVTEEYRGLGVGTVLLLKSLLSMREEGYAYAIIGWVVDAVDFYKRVVDASVIEGSSPGIYKRLISFE